MASQLVVEMTGDEAKLFRSLQKVVAEQNKMEGGLKRVGKEGKQAGNLLTKNFGDAGALLKSLKGGLAGLAAGVGASLTVGGLVKFAEGYRNSVLEIGRANVQLERTARPLLALNENADDVAGIRERLLSTSIAYGQSVQEVADARFLLESAIGGLSPAIQQATQEQALLLGRLGVNMPDAIGGASSALLIYRDRLDAATDSGQEAARMINQLVAAADLSKATQQQIFRFSPRVLQAAQGRGVGFEEALSLLPTATAISGSTELATTGVANMLNRFTEAEKKLRIKLSGPLVDQLEAVGRATGNELGQLAAIFSTELAPFVKQMIGAARDITTAQTQLNQVQADLAQRKLSRILADNQSFSAEVQNATRSLVENANAIRAGDPRTRRESILFEAAKAGAALTMPGFEQLADQAAFIMSMGSAEQNLLAAKGLPELERQARAAGNLDLADMMRVEFASQLNNPTFGPQGRRLSGQLANLDAQLANPDLTAGERSSLLTSRQYLSGRLSNEAKMFTGAAEGELYRRVIANPEAAAAAFPALATAQGDASEGGSRVTAAEFQAFVSEQRRSTEWVAQTMERIAGEMTKAAQAQQEAAQAQKDAATKQPRTINRNAQQ